MARLIHVNTSEILATRFFEHSPQPSWASDRETNNGTVVVRPWDNEHLLVEMSLGLTRDEFAVSVTIAALYEVSTEDRLETEEAQRTFFRGESNKLLPFLRTAVYNASSQVWPVQPIMLDIEDTLIFGSPRTLSDQ